MDARFIQKPTQSIPTVKHPVSTNSTRIEQTAAHWDRAWTLNRFGKGPGCCGNYFHNFVKVDELKDNSVLDVGCGDLTVGARLDPISISAFLRLNAEAYTGVDASEVAIRNSQRAYPVDSFSVADATKLPFSDKGFDLVLSFDMVTLMGVDYYKTISEMARVSRSGIMFDVLHEDWIRATRNGNSIDIAQGAVVNDSDGIQKVGLNTEALRGTLRGFGLERQEIIVLNAKEHYELVNSREMADTEVKLPDVSMQILVKAFRE